MAIFQASQTRGPRARLRMAVLGCGGALAAGAVLTSPLTASASAKTITVEPGTGHSIQTAVDKAHPGDTIKLEEGTYWQQVNITKDDITLQGDGAGETIIKPPQALSGNCDSAEGPSGICVGVAPIAEDGTVNKVVEGTTIKDLTVTGFGGSGMFIFGTDQSKVENVHATANGRYGIFFNNSTHGVIRDNLATGNNEAGIYYGHIADADGLITNNTVRGNGNGIFVRDASEGKVLDNTSTGNCLGILILDTGAGPANNHWLVQGNDVDRNNRACPGQNPPPPPPTSGIGIAVLSASFTTVRDNSVEGNNAGSNATIGTGGILVAAFAAPGNNNIVTDNRVKNNSVDLFYDNSGTGNKFADNDCDTSAIPKDLC
jgi:parallel beta-helix repeat protein